MVVRQIVPIAERCWFCYRIPANQHAVLSVNSDHIALIYLHSSRTLHLGTTKVPMQVKHDADTAPFLLDIAFIGFESVI